MTQLKNDSHQLGRHLLKHFLCSRPPFSLAFMSHQIDRKDCWGWICCCIQQDHNHKRAGTILRPHLNLLTVCSLHDSARLPGKILQFRNQIFYELITIWTIFLLVYFRAIMASESWAKTSDSIPDSSREHEKLFFFYFRCEGKIFVLLSSTHPTHFTCLGNVLFLGLMASWVGRRGSDVTRLNQVNNSGHSESIAGGLRKVVEFN